MKKIQTFFAALILIAMCAFLLTPVSSVSAAALDAVCADNPGESAVCEKKDEDSDGFVSTIVNTLLYAVGIISVIAIIIGGILFAVSGGNSSSVTKAKNTITYAIVGLLVAFLAYAIVNWVFELF